MILAALLIAAQVGAQDPRLDRLDPDTRTRVTVVVDSARRIGLPAEPLIQRALEGATKGAPGPRIVTAVRRLSVDLGTARAALGTGASAPELEAGGAPLRPGAAPQVLPNLPTLRPPPLRMGPSRPPALVAAGVP